MQKIYTMENSEDPPLYDEQEEEYVDLDAEFDWDSSSDYSSDEDEDGDEDKESDVSSTDLPEIYTMEAFLINHTLKQFIYIGPFKDLRFNGLCQYTRRFGWDVYEHRIDILRNINELTFLKKYALIDMCEEQLKRIHLPAKLIERQRQMPLPNK